MDDGTELDIVAGDAYEIPPGHDAWVVGDATFDAVEFASARNFGIAPDEEDERTLATILFTDIVDSTATLARLGDTAWRRVLLDHNDLLRSELDRFRGREIVTTGDGFLALFDSAARAVRCAAAMTGAVRGLGIEIRAGSAHRRGDRDGRQRARRRRPCGRPGRGAGRSRARSSCPRRPGTCSTDPASSSRTADHTSSRASKAPAGSTPWPAPDRRVGGPRRARVRLRAPA